MTATHPSGARLASVDILRALTMLLMIFVNDLWTLKGIPDWLEHVSAKADGLGFADTIFPAFLFITGMSVPLAIQQRQKKGDSTGQIFWHIGKRFLALIIMGLWLVNGEYLNEAAAGIKRISWNVLCCTSFVLLWNDWPKTWKPLTLWIMRIIAMGVLAFLAFICKAGEPGQIHGFETYWWGILGLIGWAYGAAAVVYALSKGKLWICVAAFLFFLLLCVAHHAKWTSNGSIIGILFGPLQSGSMPAFSMAGVVTMMVFQYFTSKNEISKMTWALFAMGIVMLLVGFWLRGFWGINKIRATPAWVLICSAATIFMFLIVYNIADIWGKAKWFEIIKPGGNNTLLCYLLPYFAYAFAVVSRIHLPDFALTAGVGLVKSFLFALLIIVIAGALGRRGLRLKL